VRILLATDTASEGIDLQKHCRRMVHVEIPFNPNRLEQRNGRIDRHGQPAPEVDIYHFVGSGYEARAGSLDGDLEFLSRAARKVEQIRNDLGDAGTVLAQQVERAMLGFDATVEVTAPQTASRSTLKRLERELRERIVVLRQKIDDSIADLGIEPEAIERVVRVGLELGRQAPLEAVTLPRLRNHRDGARAFAVPDLTRTWSAAAVGLYDEIRDRRLPITFDRAVADGRDDVVLAHLGHQLVGQSLRLLRAEMWSSGADSRLARVAGALVADASLVEPSLLVHARLVVVGHDGARLHEETIVAGGRLGGATGFARYNVGETEGALAARRAAALPQHHRVELEAAWPRIAGAVQSAVEARGADRRAALESKLQERAEREATAMRSVLNELRDTIERELERVDRNEAEQLRLWEAANELERRQLRRDLDSLRTRVAAIPAEIERDEGRLRRRYAEPRAIVFPAAIEFLVPRRFADRALGLAARRPT
ncbi:MAG: helicase-related protein, partial [Vulcanimicrobiaceae bacterium]